jgi:hypothetical protein
VTEDRKDGTVGDRVQRHQQQVVADNRAREPDRDGDGVARQEPLRDVPGEREAGDQREQVQRVRAVPAVEPAHVSSGSS